MTTLLKKMNYKAPWPIVVMNAPESFNAELEAWKNLAPVRSIPKEQVQFAVAFCTTQAEVDKAANALMPAAVGDALIWLCYPKGSSKKYKCEFNRDNGWAVPGKLGWEPVRMVAIDEDWSALRFRRAEHIKILKRSFAISEAGKEKAAKKK